MVLRLPVSGDNAIRSHTEANLQNNICVNMTNVILQMANMSTKVTSKEERFMMTREQHSMLMIPQIKVDVDNAKIMKFQRINRISTSTLLKISKKMV
jgi:hypothetical protein